MTARKKSGKSGNRSSTSRVDRSDVRHRGSPEFEHPPLIETVLGVQFDPLPDLSVSHLVAFLLSHRIDPRRIHEDRAIGQTVEPASKEEIWASRTLRVDFSGTPASRLLVQDEQADGTRLLQIENGWLILNWRSAGGSGRYPRFSKLLPEFEKWRSSFDVFLRNSGLSGTAPNLWEVGYINAIPQGELWTEPSQWSEVFPGLLASGPRVEAGPLQTAGARWVIDLAPKPARLQLQMEHARQEDAEPRELLLMKLIARGRIASKTEDDLVDELEFGHQAIVHAFVELASSRALGLWGYAP